MEKGQLETVCEKCVSGIEGLVPVEWPSAYLGMSKARIYRACNDGIPPHVKVGRNFRFSPRRVIAWAESGGKSLPGVWRREPVR